ncbi:16S rRNA (cytosine1402-N4)-methyltransferase [Paucidesulfovibrio gracilis DSM 16080]|uniref:Ribosomal RNA small subunit methyltransferase H n=1 Tax=Paucidesulfovibrio gracilis DSM 16080 TaxID=1121449 RepID=A0A1T4W537_9BACT|nr:16S rRNA (cytosine(1402)-N(4))-methyltransferase RsmH [Paucidesulfovibrio gracilis]SKA72362.1 16S rRNA (cytosine1402-N4)-methyltransferase [Paucidesulfovibrio gracilis DSM 16080]
MPCNANTDPGRLHTTVLLHEVVEWLRPRPGGRYLDGTLGMGGHSLALLDEAERQRTPADPHAELIGLDRDEQALEQAEQRLAPHGDRVHLYHLPFSRFEDALDDKQWPGVDGAVLDLGVSSLQLDRAERGFSFLESGPLDMRMDPTDGQPPARTLVNKGSYSDLKRILHRYGEEPQAGRIVKAILQAREEAPIEDTLQLARIVEQAYPAKWRAKARTHPATRTFQALRIAVNHELDELEYFLDRIAGRLNPGSRVCIISFHSLEDRAVKLAFRRAAKGCVCPPRQPMCTCEHEPEVKILTKRPLSPSEEEAGTNPRSRSAKLRVAERLTPGAEA